MSGTDQNCSRQTKHMVTLHIRHSGHQDKQHRFQDSPGVSGPVQEETGEHCSMSPAHLYLAGGLALMCRVSPPWWRRTFLLIMIFSPSNTLMWMWSCPFFCCHKAGTPAAPQVRPLTLTGSAPEQGLLPAPSPSYTLRHFSLSHLTFPQYLAITNNNVVVNDIVAMCVGVVKSVSSEHIPRNGVMVQK